MSKRIAAVLTAFILLSLIPAAGIAMAAADTEAAQTLLATYTADELLQMHDDIGALLHGNGYYPYAELERGDTGYEVIRLQTELTALGYYHKEIVDEFGNGTYNAIREFEQANGLTVNGIASPADQQLLYQKAAALTADTAASGNDLYGAYAPEELYQLWLSIGAALRDGGSYPYAVLARGNIGYEVSMLQTRLQELGYYQKTVVTNFGNGTYNAIRDFQSANGLNVTGVATAEVQQLLYSSAAKTSARQTTNSIFTSPNTNTNNTNNTNNNPDATSGATP